MNNIPPELFYFKDDGHIPNSKYPLLLYRDVTSKFGDEAADWLEATFRKNGWVNSWRWGIYTYHHYHSNTHEVLGVFSGTALLSLGGKYGTELIVNTGDVIVIPAGVAHKCTKHSNDFCVIGAYPEGRKPDLNKGLLSERPKTDENIASVPLPEKDPLTGTVNGLLAKWKSV